MKHHIIVKSLLLIFISSCSNKSGIIRENNSLLEEVSKITFPLNETSTFSTMSASFSKNNNDPEFFSFLNAYDNTLIYHDVEKPNEINIIKLLREGPDGVAQLDFGSSHLFINPDSIYLFQQQYGKLFLIDNVGKIKRKYDLYNTENVQSFTTYPNPSTQNQIQIINNELYIGCGISRYFDDYSEIGVVLKLNLNTGSISKIYRLPEIYKNNFWGSLYKYNTAISLSPKSNRLVVSFPLDHQLYEIDLEGDELANHEAGSIYFEDFEGFNTNKVYGNNNNVDWDKITRFSEVNSDYGSVIYDSFRNLYYRIVNVRPNLNEYVSGEKADFSVIALDEDFETLSETLFDSDIYSKRLIMVGSEGLYIARKDLYINNDNEIVFSIFK